LRQNKITRAVTYLVSTTYSKEKSRKDAALYKVGRLRSLMLSYLYADAHPTVKKAVQHHC